MRSRNAFSSGRSSPQVVKIVPDKILYTETWLWKQGYHAKQRWQRQA